MKTLRLAISSCVILGACVYACSSDKGDDNAAAGAGTSAGGSGARGGKSAAGGAHASGGTAASDAGAANSGNESAGASGQGGESQGEGGSADPATTGGKGGSSGRANTGGKSGGAGRGTGGKGGSSAGTGGTGGSVPVEYLAPLPGPDEIDQQPVLVSPDYVLTTDAPPTIAGALADGGMLLFGPSKALARYGADRSQVWKVTSAIPSSVNVTSAKLMPDGTTFLGGSTGSALPGETQNAGGDAVVMQLDGDGNLSWAHQWGSSGGDSTTMLAVGADGAVLSAASCSGQAPGNPADNTGGMVAARYESDGSRTFLKQYPGAKLGQNNATSLTPISMLVRDDGQALLGESTGYAAYFRSLDAMGALLGDAPVGSDDIQLGFIGSGVALAPERVLFSADHQSIYDLGGPLVGAAPPMGPPVPGAPLLVTYAFANLDLDGNVNWYRGFGGQTAIIDDVEGVQWTGDFTGLSAVGVADDAIYLAGTYQNSYVHGSTARPTTTTLFVARCQPNGEQVWFQELMLDESLLAQDPGVPGAVAGVTFDADGNPVVVFGGNAPIKTSGTAYQGRLVTFAVPLKKSDGSLL